MGNYLEEYQTLRQWAFMCISSLQPLDPFGIRHTSVSNNNLRGAAFSVILKKELPLRLPEILLQTPFLSLPCELTFSITRISLS